MLTGQRLYLSGSRARPGRGHPDPDREAARDRRRGQEPQRHDPRRLHRPPRDPDRRRCGDQADRLALLGRDPPAARVSRPQPHAAPVDRPRGGRRGGRPAGEPGRRAGRDAGRDRRATARSCATRATPSWAGRSASASSGAPPRAVRRDRRRRRARPAWRPRSMPPPRDSTSSAVEAVAPGGQAGTSARIENYLGFPAGVSGSELAQRAGAPGGEVRCASDGAGGGGRAAQRARPARDRLSNGDVATGRTRCHRHRGPVPAPRRRRGSRSSRVAASTTPPRRPRRSCARRPRRRSSAAATQPARRRCSCPQRSSSCHLLIRGGDLGEVDVALPRRPDRAQPLIELCTHTQVVELDGEHELEAVTVDEHALGRAHVPRRRRRCSSSSGPRRTPSGSRVSGAWTTPGSCSRGATCRATTSASSTAISPCSWRRAARGYSRSATSTPARSSGSLRRSARGRWRSG